MKDSECSEASHCKCWRTLWNSSKEGASPVNIHDHKNVVCSCVGYRTFYSEVFISKYYLGCLYLPLFFLLFNFDGMDISEKYCINEFLFYIFFSYISSLKFFIKSFYNFMGYYFLVKKKLLFKIRNKIKRMGFKFYTIYLLLYPSILEFVWH